MAWFDLDDSNRDDYWEDNHARVVLVAVMHSISFNFCRPQSQFGHFTTRNKKRNRACA